MWCLHRCMLYAYRFAGLTAARMYIHTHIHPDLLVLWLRSWWARAREDSESHTRSLPTTTGCRLSVPPSCGLHGMLFFLCMCMACMDVCIEVSMHVSTCVCMYVCMHVCMYVCVYLCIFHVFLCMSVMYAIQLWHHSEFDYCTNIHKCTHT